MTLRDTILNYPPALADSFLGVACQSWLKSAVDGAAGTATAETPIGQMGGATPLVAIRYVPGAALVADNANYATILIQKRTGAGAPSTVATVTTQIAGGSGNWTAFVPVNIPISAGAILAGDVVTISITKTGTGVVVPLGTLEMFQG